MRIAVAGTHCSGKSTLVHDFLAAHPDYAHEPEPYEWLEDVYGEAMPAEPAAEDFYRQLELSVARLRTYERGARVIAERSPLDLLAYILVSYDLGRDARDCALVASATELAAAGLGQVDVLVVLPLSGIAAPEEEDLELREAVNDRLLDLISTDEFGSQARVIEVQGSPRERLRMLEEAVAQR